MERITALYHAHQQAARAYGAALYWKFGEGYAVLAYHPKGQGRPGSKLRALHDNWKRLGDELTTAIENGES